MKSYRFFISGRVQGVFYRANIAKNAQTAGFSGYVRNLDDGRVETVVSCEEERLENFKKILKNGSPKSNVVSIDEQVIDELFSGDFEIYY